MTPAGTPERGECDHCTHLFPVSAMKRVIRRGYQSYQGQLWPMREEKRTALCQGCYRMLTEEVSDTVVEIEDDDS